ncbi:glycosyltransferase family 4 protein [Nakamurella aerolata]|uniref:Glycosyltransferase family 4 protein n=1 Tax=Nakamurella aerolata TaxID=1656892 RepID=A0A849A3M4_9ACTN|nr:glycosyltransferase family 4 protein [Nakamurella aerolata]NNG34657.1 glycosyltransferase family 4 protein [Nakamurella aerolata]
MRRTLLVTNDFPPRAGGIQSYLHELAIRLPAGALAVYAPAWDGAAEFDAEQPFPVYRHPTSLMLPGPAVRRRALELMDTTAAQAVWFGAAAPLALLTPSLRRHAPVLALASTHGHEVGWSMLPAARQLLRRIGNEVDVLTYVSKYARRRFATAFGPRAAMEELRPGVDTRRFRPDPVARQRIRQRYQLAEHPTVVCVSRLVPRKGQDQLVRAWPEVLRRIPEARLLIVGGGKDRNRLQALVGQHRVAHRVILTGAVPSAELADHFNAGDVFAMPSRTRGKGLDVEGLGIVYLEASACGLPVIAGDSGGAPEAVRDKTTGLVVAGRDLDALTSACTRLLGEPALRRRYGDAGLRWVRTDWTWQGSADRLAQLLAD